MKNMCGAPASRKMVVKDIHTKLNELKPEAFLRSNQLISSKSLMLLESLYNFTKQEESHATSIRDMITFSNKKKRKKSKGHTLLSKTEQPLNNLITESFDCDQIWEEIQLQNNLMYETLISCTSRLMARSKNLQTNLSSQTSVEVKTKKFLPHDNQEGLDTEDDDSVISFEGNIKKSRKEQLDEVNAGDRIGNLSRTYAKSEVDDKFFNLAQMTEFLEKVEAQLENPETNDDVDSEDDIDMFADLDDLNEDTPDPDDTRENEDAPNIYYNKFFDQPLTSDFNEENETAKPVGHGHSDDDDDIESGSEDDDEGMNIPQAPPSGSNNDTDEGESEADDYVQKKELENPQMQKDNSLSIDVIDKPSNFERRRRKIEESIQLMEEAALESKPWKYQGEVTAEKRPENSLLEEHLVYDSLVRQAPEITIETTLKLEDIIKQRVKDKAWDDVERKLKPIEDPNEFKKKLVLSAEKSKMSLAEIYEQEYINQKKAEEGETEIESKPEDELIIEKDMKSLFTKLDALSNFHYTPKPASAEIRIVTNLPSIAMEEVAPVNIADSTLLAPHEIQEPIKGEFKGKAERTESDKKHERRIKKKKQKLKEIARLERAKLKVIEIEPKEKKIGKKKVVKDVSRRKVRSKSK